ncbi:MAG: hypothetical protein RL660_2057 [Bacteroidota bacterium]|jgi:tetratricopeptide (TPR) repeat protein
MKLQLKPHNINTYPIGGLLCYGEHVMSWLEQLQALQIDLHNVDTYAIPGTKANTLWGCLVVGNFTHLADKLSKQQFCQCVNGKLFIPEFAITSPLLSKEEAEKLFPSQAHLLHPEIGLFALETPIDWASIIVPPTRSTVEITKPTEDYYTPQTLKKIEVKALPVEQLLQAMEENIFPEQKAIKEEPLNWAEKIKLGILKNLLGSKSPRQKKGSGGGEGGWTDGNISPLAKYFPFAYNYVQKLGEDLEELEKRNSSELEKLMRLFKDDPKEALKYAIPLDQDGTTRGGISSAYSMNKYWDNFNLFGSSSRGGSGSSLVGDISYSQLYNQYIATAEKLIQEKEFEKAAFVYMKLLKNHLMAAETLEKGHLYAEAAAVYLKYCNKEEKAAECFEKARMLSNAIELYKKHHSYEKVGDLYIEQNNVQEAHQYYLRAIEDFKRNNSYRNASQLYRYKMNNHEAAQQTLLEGWRSQKDSYNCLRDYFTSISNNKLLAEAIDNVYNNETDRTNKIEFLRVLRQAEVNRESIKAMTQDIAYEIVSEMASTQPAVVAQLKNFNADKLLQKDINRFG